MTAGRCRHRFMPQRPPACSLQHFQVGRIASQVVVVIADHHGDLDGRPSNPELIENRLVRLNDVRKLFGTVHEGQFPKAKGVADNEEFGVGTFLL